MCVHIDKYIHTNIHTHTEHLSAFSLAHSYGISTDISVNNMNSEITFFNLEGWGFFEHIRS